jgi:hypothetical protein
MELFKLPKGATIYYSKKGILVSTLLRDKMGWTAYGHPMVLLSIGAPPDIIGQCVIQSLNGTRDKLSSEELRNNTQEMFKLVGESSWKLLEKKWGSIHIVIEPNRKLVKIIPMRRYETGGYIYSESIFECECVETIIGNIVRGLIDGPIPEPVPYEPSHT